MNPKKLSVLVVAGVLIITVFLSFQFEGLKFNYDFEAFFPEKDPDLEFFLKHRKKYESDNDFFVISIINNKGVFNQAFLEKVTHLTEDLKKVTNVLKVESPTTISNPVIGPFGIFQIPILHPDSPEKYKEDSIKIYAEPKLVGTFFSKNGKALALFAKHKEYISKEASDSLLSAIEETLSHYTFDTIYVAGRMHGQHYFMERMKEEMSLFVLGSFLLTVFFLYLAFRSWWGVLVPLAIIVITVIWVTSLIPLTGNSIDMIKMLIPTIMFVVGMSDIVHIITKYLDELRNGNEKTDAIKLTLKEVGKATLLTSITTALGFLTLLTNNINPIQEFGAYTAAGVGIAFLLAFTVLPAFLFLVKKPKNIESIQIISWEKFLRKLFILIVRNKKGVMIGFTLLFIICAGLSLRIKVDNFLLEDLSDSDPIKESYLFFEKEFCGLRPFEMEVSISDTSKTIFDKDIINEIEKLESFISQNYSMNRLVTPATIVKSLNRAKNGGHKRYEIIPKDSTEYAENIKLLKKYKKQFESVVAKDVHSARVQGTMVDFGGRETKKRNQQLETFYQSSINSSLISYKLTGTSLLIDKNNEYLASNMMYGLLLAFGIIAVLMGFVYKSFKMAFIALIPNIFPLIAIAGYMGLTGIDLKVSTSIVFTIAFGIAVDDTIHFLSKFKLELNKGKSKLYALKRTYLSTGKAIIVTTLILSGGFLVLISSTFMSVFYIGSLISMTLILAVIADLLLLPVLLMVFYNPKK